MHVRGEGDVEVKEAPAGTPPASPLVEYAPSHFSISRRQWRALMTLTLLNTVLLGWFVVGPNSTQFLQSQWRQFKARRAEKAQLRQVMTDQQACLDYAMPREQVLFEARPAEAAKLVAEQPEYQPVRVTMQGGAPPWPVPAVRNSVPPPWKQFATAMNVRGLTFGEGAGISVSQPVVFLGARTAPGGGRRLVAVQIDASVNVTDSHPTDDVLHFATSCELVARTFHPASGQRLPQPDRKFNLHLKPPPSLLRWNVLRNMLTPERPAFLTVLTGQADPSDPSHFTLPILINGRPDVIDGWLRDDGVLLKPRRGTPSTTWQGERAWDLPVPPVAAPPRPPAAPATP